MRILLILTALCAALLLQGKIIGNPQTAYPYHLQGITADETGIYWSFTNILVKTDYKGKVLKETGLPNLHGGDMCFDGNDVFVGVLIRNPKLIAANGNSPAAVYRYSRDLKLKKIHTLPIKCGIDGIAFYKGRFYIAPDTGRKPHKVSRIMVFDRNFKFLKEEEIRTDTMKKWGAQTLTVVNGRILAAFYDNGKESPLIDPETLEITGALKLRPSVGLVKIPAKIAGNEHTYLLGVLKMGKDKKWQIYARKITITPDNKVRH